LDYPLSITTILAATLVPLTGADLSLVTNLSGDNLKTARIDRKTKLPDNLEVQWISETEFECTESAKGE